MGLRYLEQDCPLTLRDALEEYFASIPGLLTEDNSPKWVAELFRRHDVGHVVFGCDTSLHGEPLALEPCRSCSTRQLCPRLGVEHRSNIADLACSTH